jgi:hypothetical protein
VKKNTFSCIFLHICMYYSCVDLLDTQHTCMYVCMYMCVCVYIYIYVYIYSYVDLLYTHMHVCINVYI